MNSAVITEDLTSCVGVGRYANAGVEQFLPYSNPELERARNFVMRILSGFHFRTGNNLLITAQMSECVQFMSFERAVMAYGLVVCSADSTFYDAARVESIVRRFHPVAIAGITAETLAGLQTLGHDPLKLFSGIVVWARPGAYEQLQGGEITVRAWRELGPAVGIECAQGGGLHIDRLEWLVEEDGGEIVLTSHLPRAVQFERLRSGVRGHVERAACGCGSSDPRIVCEI